MNTEKTPFNPIKKVKSNLSCKFSRTGALTNQYKALAFGKGDPNFEVTDLVKEATSLALLDIEKLESPDEQSQRFLLECLAKEKSIMVQRELNPNENVVISNGATGILSSYVFGHLQPGDEVILFEPFFIWNRTFEISGVTCKYAKPLYNEEIGKFEEIDFQHIRSIISPKTKLILFINPNNPDGRVWLRSELEELAKVVEENPKINVFSDEVYCRNTYDKTEFIPFCTLPGMFERTVSNYSFGKEFFLTGWRIGGGSGPAHLIQPMAEYCRQSIKTNILLEFALGHALQLARKPYQGYDTYYQWLKADFQRRKDILAQALQNTKKFDFEVVQPMGGYAIVVDIKKSIKMVPMKYYYPQREIPESEKREFISSIEEWMSLETPGLTPDEAFNDFMIIEHGIAAIPGSAFYKYKRKNIKEQKGKSFIRFSICKKDDDIEALRKELM